MGKYLYAAAVQGIQSFIFQTNRLKEIVGASELVEEICTSAFSELLGVDVNSMTPLQALNELSRLRDLARAEEGE